MCGDVSIQDLPLQTKKAAGMNRVWLDRVQLDPVTMDETVHQITTLMSEPRSNSIHVVTLNAQFVQIARNDAEFASIIRGADLCVADGVSLVWACRSLGHPIPGRVNGTDLMVRLCEVAAERACTVYFLGGRPGAAEAAARKLLQDYAGLEIVGIDCPPMGFTNDPEVATDVSARIQQAAPDFLFVGLGAPKQEYWIRDNLGLSAKVMVGVGGSFELIGGVTKRAPLMMQKTGLEWLWRLVMEPRRLWKRYLVGNSIFIVLVFRQWISQILTSRTRAAATARAERRLK
jgi:N-acetylglucosaminyldiphosphoundecaprenol N-acetyl-beta-D-mannosaminyltransferase